MSKKVRPSVEIKASDVIKITSDEKLQELIATVPPSSLEEDKDGNLSCAVSGFFCDNRIKLETIRLLITKIDVDSFSKKSQYELLGAVINSRGIGGKDCKAKQVLRSLLEQGFDAGAESSGKDLLRVTTEQSQNPTKLNSGDVMVYAPTTKNSGLLVADSEMAVELLSTGMVAGFEGQRGVEKAEELTKLLSAENHLELKRLMRTLVRDTAPERDEKALREFRGKEVSEMGREIGEGEIKQKPDRQPPSIIQNQQQNPLSRLLECFGNCFPPRR